MSQMTYVTYGTAAPPGEYACIDCGYTLILETSGPLPPCPRAQRSPHEKRGWEVVSGRGEVPEKND